jgi:uncharacterized BrkB/YihY/UPF0761 family membrane protein
MITTFLLFAFSVIGLTHIIIDGSIMSGFRNWITRFSDRNQWPKLKELFGCYLCCGTWCGFIMGWVWISNNPFQIIACGFAGGFLANLAATVLNYLEANTIVNLPPYNPPAEEEKQNVS